ncbi:MAG TPA: SprT family zinc-dependent metalloprotease [Candidatus Saccharibacteria bacterium]|nr:SprT family zinc-dependent metalloprotease [Candidatus Saccharibacteria bacterium]
MQYKIELPEIGGHIAVVKAKTSRLSIKIDSNGLAKIRAPYLVTKAQIINFINQHKEWIVSHQQKARSSLIKFRDGSVFAGIKLNIETGGGIKNSSSFNNFDDILTIKLKHGLSADNEDAQIYIKKTFKAKLNLVAKPKLEKMLCVQAQRIDFEFSSFKNSVMKSRWGSCDSKKNIHLNSLLLMLPDDLINYVIIHELAHTKQMNHSPDFWHLVEELYPSHKEAKLKLKKYKIASLF